MLLFLGEYLSGNEVSCMSKEEQTHFDELRKCAEVELNRRVQSAVEMPHDYVEKLVHELHTHQIELEMQNEELRRAQDELGASRDRFSDLYDFAPVGYVTIDAKGMILEANLTFADMLGRERRSLLQRPFSDCIIPQDQDAFYQHRRALMESGTQHSFQLRMCKEGSDPFWTGVECVVMEGGAGEEIRIRSIVTDITERKQAEEELKRIEWMLSKRPPSAVEMEHQAPCKYQEYGDLTELNRNGEILASVGKDVLDSITTDYMEMLETSSAVYEKNGDYAYRIFSSGWCRLMDCASRKLCATDDNAEALNSGKWLCHESCWNDCSKECIAKRSPVDIECSGGIRLYAEPIFAGGDVVGCINFGYGDPPKDPDKIRELADLYQIDWDDLLREAVSYKSRPAFIIDLAKSRLCASAKMIGILVDRKRAEEQLKHYTTELETANKALDKSKHLAEAANVAKSAFLANMSHEIRTPMTAVIGCTDLLMTLDPPPAERQQHLEMIHKNAHNLMTLINDILDLSKIEAEKIDLEVKDCSPMQIVEETRSMLQVRANEKRLGLEVVHEFPLPKSIHTDPARLRQILVNLVGNAIKFTEQGLIRVTVSCVREGAGGPRMQFEVSDTGIGLSEKEIAELFQPFTQADNSTTRRFGGTGLGLSISQRLARLLGGQVVVTSEPGLGSTFTLTIDAGPLEGVDMLDSPAAVSADLQEDTKACNPEQILHGRVLLAEDDEGIQYLLRRFLEQSELEVDLATDGRAAYDMAIESMAAGRPYDLILMDIRMPLMDGYEVTKRLRQAGWAKAIIAQTAHALTGDRLKCLAAGCDNYITKPVTMEELFTLINPYLPQPGVASDSLAAAQKS